MKTHDGLLSTSTTTQSIKQPIPIVFLTFYTMTYLSAISYIAENNPTKKSFIWYRNNEKGNNRKLKQICWRKNM